MSSRKFAIDGKNKDRKDFKNRTNEKKMLPSSSGNFFIKPTKNKTLDATPSPNFKKQKEYVKKDKKSAHTSEDNAESKTEPKHFNKKAWRLKRYSNKYKLQEWKDVRKNNILRRYNRTLGKNKSSMNSDEINYSDQEKNNTQEQPTDGQAPNVFNDGGRSEPNKVFPQNEQFYKSHQEDQEVKDKKEELLKRKKEKEEAIKEYKRKKIEKFKKLSRKTKKGQPVMKDRIEILLEEIQNSIKQ